MARSSRGLGQPLLNPMPNSNWESQDQMLALLAEMQRLTQEAQRLGEKIGQRTEALLAEWESKQLSRHLARVETTDASEQS
jgi:hypothetical protein